MKPRQSRVRVIPCLLMLTAGLVLMRPPHLAAQVAAGYGPNLANGVATGGTAIPVQVAAYGGGYVWNFNNGTCADAWQLVGTLCDESPTTHSPTISSKTITHSGATWSSVGTGVLVVDLGVPRTFNLVHVFQMFSDGKITHFRISTHPAGGPSRPDWQDAGWTPLNGFDLIGPGQARGNQVIAPTAIQLPATTSRYVKVEARNDGRYDDARYEDPSCEDEGCEEEGWTELRAFKLFLISDAPPAADAGADFSVDEGQPVVLDGSGSSDPDNDPLTYAWMQVGGSTVTLSNAASRSRPSHARSSRLGGETLTFDLTVTANGQSSIDTVSVTVVNVNHPPVAEAGDDQSIAEGSPVTLHGENSFDIDDDPFSHMPGCRSAAARR